MILKLLHPSVSFLVTARVLVQKNGASTLGRSFNHNSLGIRLQSTKPNWKSSPLVSSLWTIPNMLTLSRIASAPVIGHFIMTQNLTPALCLFTYSCITDFLDGFIARKYNKKSVAGTILDPMADKLLMIAATCSLSFPPGPQIIPLPIASLILGRDLLLGLSAIYFRYSSMQYTYGRVTWRSYSDIFNYPSAEVKPTKISKWNTFLQMLYLGWAIVLMIQDTQYEKGQKNIESEQSLLSSWFPYAGYVVATTTVLSGASYAFNKNTIRYLNKKR